MMLRVALSAVKQWDGKSVPTRLFATRKQFHGRNIEAAGAQI
jgi:hypothetical protein